MPRPGEDRSDVGGAVQFNNIGPVPLSPFERRNGGGLACGNAVILREKSGRCWRRGRSICQRIGSSGSIKPTDLPGISANAGENGPRPVRRPTHPGMLAPKNGRAQTDDAQELEALRRSVQRGRPFGQPEWQQEIAKRLGLESAYRPTGRPRKVGRNQNASPG